LLETDYESSIFFRQRRQGGGGGMAAGLQHPQTPKTEI
jgi:hypothetical protein